MWCLWEIRNSVTRYPVNLMNQCQKHAKHGFPNWDGCKFIDCADRVLQLSIDTGWVWFVWIEHLGGFSSTWFALKIKDWMTSRSIRLHISKPHQPTYGLPRAVRLSPGSWIFRWKHLCLEPIIAAAFLIDNPLNRTSSWWAQAEESIKEVEKRNKNAAMRLYASVSYIFWSRSAYNLNIPELWIYTTNRLNRHNSSSLGSPL